MKPFPRQRGAQVPLTRPQKGYLSRLAGEAHAFLEGNGAIDERPAEFRQREAISACGRRISEAVNGDFEVLEAHFLSLKGQTSRAFQSALRSDTNEERQARWKLHKLCQERGLETPALEGATVKQIWAVFFNIKNQPKRRAQAGEQEVAKLTAQMKQAVQQERYEDAAALKRQIEALLSAKPAPRPMPMPTAPEDDDIPY